MRLSSHLFCFGLHFKIQSVDFLSTLYHTKVKISTPTFPPSHNTWSSYTHATEPTRASCNPRATILYKLRPLLYLTKARKYVIIKG